MTPSVSVTVDGKTYEVQSGAVVGREKSTQIVFGHPDVSRRHAELRLTSSGFEIRDLGSTNGLWVVGGRRERIALKPGQRNRVWLGPPATSPHIDLYIATEPTGSPPSEGPPQLAMPQPLAQGIQSSPGFVPYSPDHNALNQEALAANIGTFSQVHQPGAELFLIGRSRSCDVVVNDPLVSRRHVQFVRNGPKSGQLKDLGSDNGTYVNGARIQTAEIVAGDLVELGRTQFIFRDGILEQHVAYGLPLQAANLSVTVGKDLRILQNVSFTLPAGSLTAIVGPSGSGKTTLLNAITGLSKADVGHVVLGGRQVYDPDANVKQRIGFVPQDDSVHTNLTVHQALTFAAKLRLPQDTQRREIDQTVSKVAAELGLAERLDSRIKTLSGGQKKRVSVGYELVGEPQALVLDEPTSGLDPGLERELMLNLRELSDRGTTTVVVTHSVQSVELCDQVIVLAPGGRLAFVGPTNKAIEHFAVPDFARVFSLLSSRPETEWERHFERTSSYQRFVTVPPSTLQRPAFKRSRRSFFRDLTILTSRYVKQIAGDPKRLAALIAQAPFLGLLLAFVVGTSAFSQTGATREYLAAMVLAITLLGALNSVLEIVQERPVFRREFNVGVSNMAFVLSRWSVLSVVVVVQSVILLGLGSIRQADGLNPGVLVSTTGWVELFLAIAGIGVASLGVGLAVSALVTDTTKALIVLLLVIIPVVLLSGVVIPTSKRLGVEQVTYLNPVQWGSSAAAVVLDLPASEGCSQSGIEPVNLPGGGVGEQPVTDFDGLSASCRNHLWERTAATQVVNLGMLGALTVVLMAVSTLAAYHTISRPIRR